MIFYFYCTILCVAFSSFCLRKDDQILKSGSQSWKGMREAFKILMNCLRSEKHFVMKPWTFPSSTIPLVSQVLWNHFALESKFILLVYFVREFLGTNLKVQQNLWSVNVKRNLMVEIFKRSRLFWNVEFNPNAKHSAKNEKKLLNCNLKSNKKCRNIKMEIV